MTQDHVMHLLLVSGIWLVVLPAQPGVPMTVRSMVCTILGSPD